MFSWLMFETLYITILVGLTPIWINSPLHDATYDKNHNLCDNAPMNGRLLSFAVSLAWLGIIFIPLCTLVITAFINKA